VDKLSDQFPQCLVVRVAACLGAQQGGGDGDGLVPVGDEVLRARVEEEGAGAVGAAVVVDRVAGERGCQDCPGECVAGDDVEATVGDEGRGQGHGVEQPLDAGREVDGLAAPGCVRSPFGIEQALPSPLAAGTP
jgi:hypothetical protein